LDQRPVCGSSDAGNRVALQARGRFERLVDPVARVGVSGTNHKAGVW